MSEKTYDRALAELQRALVFGINPSLDGISELTRELGDPHRHFRSVQITGTNGKTSTSRYTEALLRAHGLSTALYTSPELERYPERMEVGGRVSADQLFAAAVWAALDAAGRLRPGRHGSDTGFTEFELLTAAALWLFADQAVDWAVLEVGLGGRWDATSVVSPTVAVITGVGLDHTHILGDTREAIAAEKAAIVRPGSTAVLGPGTDGVERVFLDRAEHVGAPVHAVRAFGEGSPLAERSTVRFAVDEPMRDVSAGGTRFHVRGVHAEYPGLELRAPAFQAANAATAIAAAEAALDGPLDEAGVRRALAQASIPGRFEVVARQPTTLIDAAHNPEAAGVLARCIEQTMMGCMPTVVLGVLADKDASGIVAALAPVASSFVATRSTSPRALGAEELADLIAARTGVRPETGSSVAAAIAKAREGESRPVVVTGSITVAGEARRWLRDGSATTGTS